MSYPEPCVQCGKRAHIFDPEQQLCKGSTEWDILDTLRSSPTSLSAPHIGAEIGAIRVIIHRSLNILRDAGFVMLDGKTKGRRPVRRWAITDEGVAAWEHAA